MKKEERITYTAIKKTEYYTKSKIPILWVEERLKEGIKRYSYDWSFSFIEKKKRIVNEVEVYGIIKPEVFRHIKNEMEKIGFDVYLARNSSGVKKITCKYKSRLMKEKFNHENLLKKVENFKIPESVKITDIRGPYHDTEDYINMYEIPANIYFGSEWRYYIKGYKWN